MASIPQIPLRHLVLVVLLAAAPLAAQESANGLFLWEARGETGKAYLLGSIHVAKPELYPLDPAIEEAFEASEVLAVEVDPAAAGQGSLQTQMLAAGVYTEGGTLEENVSGETLRQFQAFLTARDLPFSRFNTMRPWFAAILVSVTEIMRLGYDPAIGIDRHFLRQAKESGKEVRSLESADFQIRLLSQLSAELQELFLVYTLRDIGKLGGIMDEMVTAWERGQTEVIEAWLLDPEDMAGPLAPIYDRIFFDRNHDMALKIADMIETGGTSFVVVGAGHMIGDRGVVALLEKDARFAVHQVSAQGAPVAAVRQREGLPTARPPGSARIRGTVPAASSRQSSRPDR